MAELCRYGHQRWPDLLEMPLDDLLSLHSHVADIIAAENKSGTVNTD